MKEFTAGRSAITTIALSKGNHGRCAAKPARPPHTGDHDSNRHGRSRRLEHHAGVLRKWERQSEHLIVGLPGIEVYLSLLPYRSHTVQQVTSVLTISALRFITAGILHR